MDVPTPVIAALLGTIVGFSLNLARDSFIDRRRVLTARKQLASALLAEIIAFQTRTLPTFDLVLKEPNEPLHLPQLSCVTNLFAIYDRNTDKLGVFGNDVGMIVEGFAACKAHLEALNDIVQPIQELSNQIVTLQASHNVAAAQDLEARQKALIDTAIGRLNRVNKDIGVYVDLAKAALKKYAQGA